MENVSKFTLSSNKIVAQLRFKVDIVPLSLHICSLPIIERDELLYISSVNSCEFSGWPNLSYVIPILFHTYFTVPIFYKITNFIFYPYAFS